jgi:hypothetical protein
MKVAIYREVSVKDCIDEVRFADTSLRADSIIHRAQGYPSRWGLSTGLNHRGKSLEIWFEGVHSDIVKYVHRILHIFTTSQSIRVWGIYDPNKVCTRCPYSTQSVDL